ncbi:MULTISPECIES: hypothetical protein [Nocardia]|uniref:hypothetical protein n=1 Tax=Nocardia TaxID=1817 RepID=UPI001E3176AB|nr:MULTISPECIES: hypothetical protein [Nocardia]
MPVPPPVPATPGTPAAQVGAVTRADPATGAVASADPETSVAPTGADSELPRDVLAVVARWNPQGAALLRAARGAGAGSAVALIGPDDANTTLLRTELARFEPRIDLTEPMGEVGSSVESTLPGATPAAVALVLLDAGSVVGADSLGLIRRLRAEDTRILLAMNGIHAYGDWRSVRDRDLELLAAQDLADLDIIPVSARLAAAARAGGDAALMDRSGLGALHTELTEASASASAPGDGRLAALDARVLAETRTRVQAQLETLRSGAEPTRWRAERATLIASRDSGRATAMSTLRGQLHLARVDLMTEVGGQVRALHVAARAELDRQRQADLAHYPDRLQQVVTELTGVIDIGIDRRLAELAAKVDADGVSTGDTPSGNVAPPHRRRDAAPRVGPDPEPRHRGVEDHLMIALGASAGVGLGRLLVSPLALVSALDVASIPVTLALGALVAWWVVRTRRQVADRAHVRQWVADALVNVKAALEQRVATALVEAETELADRVVRASAARIIDTDRRVAELETRIRRAAAEQPAQLAACERDIATLDRRNRLLDW